VRRSVAGSETATINNSINEVLKALKIQIAF
jgi:hypothetical protein